MAQPLGKLIAAIEALEIEGDLEKEIRGVVQDSRRVEKGFLFVALHGLKGDGHRHIEEAVKRGAVAVVYEKRTRTSREPAPASDGSGEGSPGNPSADGGWENPFHRDPRVAYLRVADSRRALAHLAAAYFDHPSSQLALIGITGTNGKTTTAHILESILEAAGCRVGYIGTLGYRLNGRTVSTNLTTPEAPDLQRILSEMVMNGLSHAILEVSSHALKLDRVEGCRFLVGIFTNLTRDHLDFHGTLEDYFASKRRLFRDLSVGTAVVNRDDPWSVPLLEGIAVPTLTYGLEGEADICAHEVHLSPIGISLTASTPQGRIPLESPLGGRYNIYNILAAVGTACSLKVSPEEIRRGIGSLRGVPGRFERVESGQDFSVIVDYAHTEDALERLLRAAREVSPSRLITVFGCGGDRDKGKRPRMGKVAISYSDHTFITSDNPRSEDPEAILLDIVQGFRQAAPENPGVQATTCEPFPGGGRYEVVVDRQEAIQRAIMSAGPGDIVVIAGKGHETYQILQDRTIHFDDREVAREAIRLRMH